MRELIYLSENKLNSFISYPSPVWKRLLLSSEININLGPFGGFKIAAHINSNHEMTDKLNEVVAYIESHIKWYEDKSTNVGEWIAFKVPMNYVITDSHPDYPVIFLDDKTTFPGKKRRKIVRLLLHGSAKNLLGEHKKTYPLEEYAAGINGSNVASIYSFVSTLRYDKIDPLSLEPIKPTKNNLSFILSDLDTFIFDQLPSHEWFSGYARITAVDTTEKERRIVFATPLFVERHNHDAKRTGHQKHK